MAICKKCGVDVQDGQDLCEKCAKSQSNSPTFDESYLDSLLQSVIDPQLTKSDENEGNFESNLPNENIDLTLNNLNLEENGNVQSEESFGLEEEAESEKMTFSLEEEPESEEVVPAMEEKSKSEEEIPAMEKELESVETMTDLGDEDVAELNLFESSGEQSSEIENLLQNANDLDSLEPAGLEDMDLDSLESINLENESLNKMKTEELQNDLLSDSEIVEMEKENHDADDTLDDMVGNLLNDLDNTDEASLSKEETLSEPDSLEEITDLEKEAVVTSDASDPMGDVEDLLGMLADEVTQEENSTESVQDSLNDINMEDVSVSDEVFSLDGVENIEDLLSDSAQSIETIEETPDKSEIFHELDDLEENLENDILGELPSKEELKKKKGIFQKLFGNIYDAKSKKAHKKMEESEEKALQKKEEKKKKKAEKKAAKNDPAVKAEKEAQKKEKEEKKAAAKAAKEAKKKEKEEKKKQRLAEEEAEAKEDPGRINPVGASIVFVLVGAATVFVIFGSKNFSYTQSVVKANEYFASREYNEAYDEVKGITIKDKDSETYDKIMTVMYVNKQLNSYNNYYAMQMYPQALDSLLKGLKKYDEYIDTAKQLGVTSDFDYVKKQILKEIEHIFQLSEKEAYKIINSDDQETYSRKVIETAEKNMNDK
ncbi:hypothetical protein [Velocimicrobium porci]|uniref:Uncharacterized protein n=1 Tax=Velocimicrobium porci TaxID=2606634 RepID=A0A6L5XWR3_9FIRM|nr:hypothetical protein [Velocimicrobium porci]MSS63280.1 hypothetical protein [Velocimicrobium porci]